MTLKIQSNIDYDQVCKELGISIETLLSLSSSTQNLKTVTKVSFIKAADDFLENLKILVKNDVRSETTLTTYTNFIGRIQNYIINKIDPELPLDRFNERMLFGYFSTLSPRSKKKDDKLEGEKKEQNKEEKLSNYTTNKYIAIIRKLFKFAYTVEYTDKDLSFRFEPSRISLLPRYFTIEQLKSILKFSYKRTYGYRWHTMICFMLATGCRISETTNIKLKDINFEDDIILINGKGDKDRYVPIYPELKRLLYNYLDKTGLTNKNACNGYLFSRDEDNKRNIKISERSLQYQVSNILSDAGIDEAYYTTHSFRHTFAVNCLKAGMKIEYLSQLLGHINPATTSIYVQLLPVDLRDEVMKKYPFPIESLLGEIL